LTELLL